MLASILHDILLAAKTLHASHHLPSWMLYVAYAVAAMIVIGAIAPSIMRWFILPIVALMKGRGGKVIPFDEATGPHGSAGVAPASAAPSWGSRTAAPPS